MVTLEARHETPHWTRLEPFQQDDVGAFWQARQLSRLMRSNEEWLKESCYRVDFVFCSDAAPVVAHRIRALALMDEDGFAREDGVARFTIRRALGQGGVLPRNDALGISKVAHLRPLDVAADNPLFSENGSTFGMVDYWLGEPYDGDLRLHDDVARDTLEMGIRKLGPLSLRSETSLVLLSSIRFGNIRLPELPEHQPTGFVEYMGGLQSTPELTTVRGSNVREVIKTGGPGERLFFTTISFSDLVGGRLNEIHLDI